MRVALLADIHGNLVALEAVLGDLERSRVDHIVCLGDVAAFGPQPAEAIERIRALGCLTVMGNADALLLGDLPEPQDEHARRLSDLLGWGRERLSAADLDFLRSFAPTLMIDLDDGVELLGFHGSPRSYDDRILATTPENELEPMLSGYGATVMAGGHTHVQMLRRFREGVLLNTGSVGLPAETIPADASPRAQAEEPLAPWAEYAIVSAQGGVVAIELKRVAVDVGAARDAARASGMPHADWWARGV